MQNINFVRKFFKSTFSLLNTKEIEINITIKNTKISENKIKKPKRLKLSNNILSKYPILNYSTTADYAADERG